MITRKKSYSRLNGKIRTTVIDLNSTADFNEFCRSAELFCLHPLCTGSDTQWIFVSKVEISGICLSGFIHRTICTSVGN
jgi:hypothetical protein